jgi:hypothetical protein
MFKYGATELGKYLYRDTKSINHFHEGSAGPSGHVLGPSTGVTVIKLSFSCNSHFSPRDLGPDRDCMMSTQLCVLLVLSVCSDVSFAGSAAPAPSAGTTVHDVNGTTASTVQIYRTDSMEPLNGYCPGQGIITVGGGSGRRGRI